MKASGMALLIGLYYLVFQRVDVRVRKMKLVYAAFICVWEDIGPILQFRKYSLEIQYITVWHCQGLSVRKIKKVQVTIAV